MARRSAPAESSGDGSSPAITRWRAARERVLLELIELIYAAAGDPTHWQAFLDRLRKSLSAEHNALWLQDLAVPDQGATVLSSIGTEASHARSYTEYYGARNAYLISGRSLLKPGAVCFDEMLCPPPELARTEFYNDWVVPQHMSDAIFGVVLQNASALSVLCLVHHQNTRPFSENDRLFLNVLMPHLQRAIQLHLRISGLERRSVAATQALDRWSLGVILLDHAGRVLLMNRSVERILNRNDGLVYSTDGLRAAWPKETRMLRHLILGAIEASLGSGIGVCPGGALSLSRPSGKSPLSLLVTPVCANHSMFPSAGAAAAIFVSDPHATEETNENVLRPLYGLSRAEAALAVLLLKGQDLKEASEELCVSVSTVRTHLKQLFEKTSTKRQAELVRLLLRSPAALSLGH